VDRVRPRLHRGGVDRARERAVHAAAAVSELGVLAPRAVRAVRGGAAGVPHSLRQRDGVRCVLYTGPHTTAFAW
jgi:hypothetical protein